jgi:hypothetical protein
MVGNAESVHPNALVLNPWQLMKAPAAEASTLLLRIDIALETFQYIKGLGESRLGSGLRRVGRTFAATAQEQYDLIFLDLGFQLTCKAWIAR